MDRIRIRLSAASPFQDNGSDIRAENLTSVTRPRQRARGFFFPQVIFRPFRTGCGEDGIRTRYPLLAKQVLYRLSYFPSFSSPHVRVPGFEPGTSALSELRSSQLSYTRGRRSLETQEPNHSGLALSANRIPGES